MKLLLQRPNWLNVMNTNDLEIAVTNVLIIYLKIIKESQTEY